MRVRNRLPHPVAVGDGRVLAPGETVDLNNNPRIAHLIDTGVLAAVKQQRRPAPPVQSADSSEKE